MQVRARMVIYGPEINAKALYIALSCDDLNPYLRHPRDTYRAIQDQCRPAPPPWEAGQEHHDLALYTRDNNIF